MWKYTSTEELMHGYKYIKKIKTPNGWRYFYSQAEIDAYNREVRGGTQNSSGVYPNRPRPRRKAITGSMNLVATKDEKSKPVDYGHLVSDKLKDSRKKAEKVYKKAEKNAKNEAAGAKRAVEIWREPKRKKGDKIAMYRPNEDKYYDEMNVTNVKKNGRGGQTVSVDWKKRKKRKTTRLERMSLRAYRKTHPYE